MKHLLLYFKKYKKESILAPAFKMLEAIFDLIVPIVVAQIIDIGIVNRDKNYIIGRFFILILMALLGLGCTAVAQYFSAKAAVGTAAGLRSQLLSHIGSLSFSQQDKLGTSTLVTRLTADVNQVQNGLNMFLRLFLRSPFIVFGSVVMAFTINSEMALIFAVIIPILFVIVFGIMKITRQMYADSQKRLDKVTQATRENLDGVRVVRAFGREKTEQKLFEDVNTALAKAQRKAGTWGALSSPLTYIVINAGIILILWYGGQRVDGGTLLSGDVIALVNYLSQILVELVKLANLIVLIGKAMASMNRIGQILDTENTMKYGDVTYVRDDAEYAVEFDAVGLKYTETDEALTDITFKLKKGSHMGIIGSTGSGKTSVVSLISRFYDATDGEIKLLGEPIQSRSKEDITSRVSVVMQRSQLFSGTVRSNLLYGDPTADEAKMWRALDAAQASDFVKDKKGGLDAAIDHGGRNLSGGQKQRLSIARALISDPDILILDDSSSALDYATDASLRRAISQIPDMTLITVSQRTSSIMSCDIILVLEDGCAVGLGTHSELLQTCDVYREIHESTDTKEATL